ncbi:MAG: methyltransferase domain-containing protein [Candidatus Micrarchaeaceae archaeon]
MADWLVSRAYSKLKRGPQVILPKDIGLIIGYSGIGKGSRCADAGTGSGWLAVSLAKVAESVVSYDINENFISIARKNAEMLSLDNITFKHADFTKKIDEKASSFDLVTLDMPNSQKCLKNAFRILKPGGAVAGYLPHSEQLNSFVMTMEKIGFEGIFSLEPIIRDMLVRKEGTRPSTKGVWHTAYLCFGYKPDRKK